MQNKWPAADPGDVSSIEALVRAFDHALSFAPRQYQRSSDRLRSLFLPTAAVVSPQPWNLATDANGFIEFLDNAVVELGLESSGFAEHNTVRRVVTIGNVNSVYTYYTLHSPPENRDAFARGVNMFHIVRMNDRYAISSLTWEDESPAAPTPPDLQPHG